MRYSKPKYYTVIVKVVQVYVHVTQLSISASCY